MYLPVVTFQYMSSLKVAISTAGPVGPQGTCQRCATEKKQVPTPVTLKESAGEEKSGQASSGSSE